MRLAIIVTAAVLLTGFYQIPRLPEAQKHAAALDFVRQSDELSPWLAAHPRFATLDELNPGEEGVHCDFDPDPSVAAAVCIRGDTVYVERISN